ncbi:FMN-dependent NADH-azoreductase [Marinicella litoralis]|uniref:FMN dependent NADH:quinone oxidoreductase n=1 Tax=Marinicella litoralis TaxID=644220 RepID=A0A4R6XGD0_9GAMM|nr:NAD(P)H-dependent oxidoreductase [Marinicella litoralis]TDR16860.1 FMN-dependent NADH-azoreductase [Marinicella litoralis]
MKKTLLTINSSGRQTDSITRKMVEKVREHINLTHSHITVIDRDLSSGMPYIDESWINANFTPDENRNTAHLIRLQQSDELVGEIKQADYIVIGSPIYNFSIPAVLKAWIDQIARARLTFKYTEQGPVGLMTGKKAILVMASGGVPIESTLDFATPYLKQLLSFIGITDVTVIDANYHEKMTTEILTGFSQSIMNEIETGKTLNSGAQHV